MHIHILGIAGTMTAPLAVELKLHHNIVTGSDQKNIYPPISTLLKRADIPVNKTPITSKIDLCIVGSSYRSFSQTKDDYRQIKKLKIPHISATKYIAENISKKNTILIAGAYGKTSITALVAYILTKAGFNPSYMFGGIAKNRFPSVKITTSDWAVIEADESINGLDTKAKFLYYHLKHLVLTSAHWEHKESYPTAQHNKNAFIKLIQKIPNNGYFIINQQEPLLKNFIPHSRGQTISYPSSSNYPTSLVGPFWQSNISAAASVCKVIGIKEKTIRSSISSFKGIKRRLELVASHRSVLIFDDFAQSAYRIKQVIDTIKSCYPQHRLIVLFEPHSNFINDKRSLKNFRPSFQKADAVVLCRPKYSLKISLKNRVTPSFIINAIDPSKTTYFPEISTAKDFLFRQLRPKSVLLRLSSGGLDGHKLIATLSSLINKN